MDTFFFTYMWMIIYYFLNLCIQIKAEIQNNPVLLPFSNNPFLYNSLEDIQFYIENQKYVQNPTSREVSSPISFCPLTEINTLILNEETNKYYIYTQSSQYLISISDSNCQSKDISQMQFPETNKYYGSIFEGEFNPSYFYVSSSGQSKTNLRCQQLNNEIIIYSKTENDIGFYYVENKKTVNLDINCDIDDYFSCSKIDNSVYFCIYLCHRQINVNFFAYVTPLANSQGNCEIKNIIDNRINPGNSYSNLLTVHNKELKKILICVKSDNDEIECYSTSYSYQEYEISSNNDNNNENGNEFGNDEGNGEGNGEGDGNDNNQNNEAVNDFDIDFQYPESPSFSITLENSNNEGACVLKNSIDNEYLLCCGDEDSIKCIRIDNNFEQLNSFSLNIEGTNSHLNFISSSEYIHLIYMNTLYSVNKMYEYSIYIPKCSDKTYSLIPLGTISDDVNNLFIREINTNYYIKFKSFPSTHLKLSFNNEELFNENLTFFEPVLLDDNYPFEFSSIDTVSTNNLKINYEIILEETFSSNCMATINILECYRSCKACTKSNSESDDNNHNCVAGKCNDNYYQDPDVETNCWDTYQAKQNWYLDYENYRFQYCHEECLSCDGPTNKNCRSCRTDSELKYLYISKCLAECPDGFYPSSQKCDECYSTCGTCSGKGSQYNMNCITCQPNSIKYDKNCFSIDDPILKTFIRPWDNSISSCYDHYSYYIKEDSDTCIPSILEGYFLSNAATGVISACHPDCKTCSEKYTETNSKCLLCKDENLYFFNGNCVENQKVKLIHKINV